MNVFDEIYDIRLARADETEKLMHYVAEDWRAGHIMSVNKELFLHEFLTSDEGMLNVIIALRKDNAQIDGMLGFLPASKESRPDLWGSMWKVRSGSRMFLGNELMQRLLAIVPHRNFTGIGMDRSTTGQLVKRTLGDMVGRLKHWYILNEDAEYRIARICEKKKAGFKDTDTEFSEAFSIADLDRCFDYEALKGTEPYKDRWYIGRRYFEYPIHRYRVFLVGGDKADALLVTRTVEYDGSRVLRIMDFLGNRSRIGEAGRFLRSIISKEGCEYVDFYENGFAEEDVKSAGFVERREGDENIIPNYFAPFEQSNIEIYYHAQEPGYFCCKADGDQDRPN
ncbi:MAG: hypothetical protein IK115_03805 [Lachnospiraceae bacterium]|nr:hypothetical protein [Lachnospiraceae bacterium]